MLPAASQISINKCFDTLEKKLKKLLEAVEHEVLKKPNRKTLDRLSLLAGFQDWDAFQNSFKGDPDSDTPPT